MSVAAPSPAARQVATAFGIGLLPSAPGTWASAATIPFAWALHAAGGFWLLALATLAVTAAGFWAAALYIEGRADKDPKEVVIDEVAGMMLTLWPLSWGLTAADAEPWVWPWPGWVLGFLAFRFLDIVKPGPVGWADRQPGVLGVMLDDLLAGLIAAALMFLAAGIAHGWF